MVPELSRSADHLCHGDEQQGTENDNEDDNEYIKGPLLKTPDYLNCGYVKFSFVIRRREIPFDIESFPD